MMRDKRWERVFATATRDVDMYMVNVWVTVYNPSTKREEIVHCGGALQLEPNVLYSENPFPVKVVKEIIRVIDQRMEDIGVALELEND